MNKLFLLFVSMLFVKLGFSQKRDASFEAFWPVFRTAAAAGVLPDSLVVYPVKAHGILDSDPVKKYDAARFKKWWPVFLKQEDGVADTHGGFIKKYERLPDNECAYCKPDYCRINDLVFKKMNGKWKLVELYMNGEEY